ncbi:MAG: two-component system sensor histidine kinase/response regulator [Candidatus Azotimanducaceae bacterium]|jgi:two-component system sensor histidine kinase/response regulator
MSGSPTFENVTSLPGIVLEDGLAIVRNNRSLYFLLLSKFRDAISEFRQKIYRSIDNDDYQSASNMSHNLKGVAANLGINHLSELAATLDEECRQQLVDIENTFNAVVLEIELIINGLEWLPET